MRAGVTFIAFAVSLLGMPAVAQAQQHEIYIGPNAGGVSPPRSPASINYLAKCLADPGDHLSCHIANSANTDSGQESAMKGQMHATNYVTCEKEAGVCVEIAALDLTDDKLVTPAERIKFVSVEVLFDYDSVNVRATEGRKLTQLAAALKDPINATTSFAIIGHTDIRGSDVYNCALSRRRAGAGRGRDL